MTKITSSSVVNNGVFWISLNTPKRAIIEKLGNLKKEAAAERGILHLESFRIFNTHSDASSDESKDIQNAISGTFAYLGAIGQHCTHLYLRIGDQHKIFAGILEQAVSIFDEVTIHGEYRGVCLNQTVVHTLQAAINLSSISKLTLMYISLTRGQIEELASSIACAKTFRVLGFFRCSLQDCRPLAHGLKLNKSLQELSLVDTRLLDASLSTLLKSVQGHESLRKISLESNSCRDLSLAALRAGLLQASCQIVDIDLSRQVRHSPYLTFSLERLLQGIESNQSLQRLNLSGNELTQGAFQSLWDTVEKMSLLEVLDVSYNRIEELPIVKKKQSPSMRPSSLRVLNLFGNPVYDTGRRTSDRTIQMLCSILRSAHPRLGFLGGRFERSQLYTLETQMELDMNEAGRILLSTSDTRLSLWPAVFERVNTLFGDDLSRKADAMHQLFRGLAFGPMGGQI